MKDRLISSLFLVFLLACVMHSRVHSGEQNLNDFILRIQNSIAQKDVTAYLENFSDEIQSRRRIKFQ